MVAIKSNLDAFALMIRPVLLTLINGRSDRVTRKGLSRLIAQTSRHSVYEISSKGVTGNLPALLIRISTAPHVCCT
ncbi:MAG: hypothetical protein V7K49_33820 [Nostoc sp.]